MENYELINEQKRIADSLEAIANFTKCYGRLIDAMGLSNEKTVDFVKKSITKAIEEQKELDAQKAEDAEAEKACKKSRLDLELENEYLTKKVEILEEELEAAYADLSDKEDD